MRAIVAADEHWGIGKDNKLLVSIPQDMKFFRNETNVRKLSECPATAKPQKYCPYQRHVLYGERCHCCP